MEVQRKHDDSGHDHDDVAGQFNPAFQKKPSLDTLSSWKTFLLFAGSSLWPYVGWDTGRAVPYFEPWGPLLAGHQCDSPKET